MPNPNIDISSKKIGELVVYQEQVRCAQKILQVFEAGGGPPLLVAQMQQGKTGTMICVIDQFINNCKTNGITYEVIYLTNVQDNELKNQVKRRLLPTGLLSEIANIHLSAIQDDKFSINKNVDRRLIIIDECHLALEKNKPFHQFAIKCGFNYGQPINTWENKNNFVLSCSATPYAHIIVTALKDRAFEPITLDISEKYYSLQHLNQSNRIKKSDKVTSKVKNEQQVTTFFKERVKELLELCKIKGPGFMVVRSTSNGPEAIEKYIKENFKSEIDVHTYEARPVNNIANLDDELSTKIAKPFIAIVRGSMRAGKTLTTTKNIRMWIEPPSSKMDTVAQAIGRCLGYELENGINRKFEDTFPVYCNTKEIQVAIDFYNDYKSVPSGVGNKTNTNMIHICDIEILNCTVESEIREKYNAIISKCSAGDKNSYAEIVLNKQLRGFSKEEAAKERIYYMDGPHKSHQKDWEDLLKAYPDIEGKFVRISHVEDKKVQNTKVSLLDSKRLLS